MFYRIRVARIAVPALRERREDIPPLVRAFLDEIRVKTDRAVHDVSDDAMRVLLAYRWPGNVRELRNALEFGAVCAKGSSIQPQDLPPEVLEEERPRSDQPELIRAVLAYAGDNRKKAAELLGISRATLYRRLEHLGIKTNAGTK